MARTIPEPNENDRLEAQRLWGNFGGGTMKTKKEILYQAYPYPGVIARIPAGTPVVPADNLPVANQFWVCPWANMTDKEESWERNYGFLLQLEEVE